MTATTSTAGKDTLRLTSSAFRQGDVIPVQFTCEGEDLSPPLEWSGAPLETRSFALICDDPDAPRGVWVHWLLYNLPGDTVRLEAGVPIGPELPSGARQGLNDSGDLGYGGPCPPPGYLHRYFFRLHALDAVLGLPPGLHRADLEKAMSGHILVQSSLMGTFQRHRKQ